MFCWKAYNAFRWSLRQQGLLIFTKGGVAGIVVGSVVGSVVSATGIAIGRNMLQYELEESGHAAGAGVGAAVRAGERFRAGLEWAAGRQGGGDPFGSRHEFEMSHVG